MIQSGGDNLLAGNLIGTTASGSNALGNTLDGITVDRSPGNTIGGTASGAANVIAGNGQAGVDLTGIATTGTVTNGNFIGTNSLGSDSLGNGTDGVLVQAGSAGNTIGGTATGAGNTIAYNLASGVAIESGNGNAVLSNAIFANALMGINLSAGANDGISPPVVGAAIPDAVTSTTNVQWTYTAPVTGIYRFEFFSNASADPSGNFEGQTPIGSVTLSVSAGGVASLSADLSGAVSSGLQITETVTYQGTPSLLMPGDSSAFSGAAPAIAVAIQFASATSSWSTPGIATILVDRAGNTSGTVSVGFATADGTAVAGVDYASTSGSLTFAPGVTTQSISVPLLDARIAVGDFAFTITLSTPAGGATLGTPATTTVIIDVDNQGGQFHIYIVDTDSGAVVQDGTNSGSLPWAIAQSNANPSSSPALPNEIVFAIPGTGVRTIQPTAVLPTITEPVAIDGYSQPGSQTNTTATGDTATLLVQIDGSQLVGSGIDGLTIAAYDCAVNGLIITGFSGAGVALETPSTPFPLAAIGAHIWGNFIGVAQFSTLQDIVVDPTRNPDANQAGIIVASSNNHIGGALPVGRNLIQGNKEAGVILYGSGATGNLVEGNFILDNGGDGVLVLSSSNEIGQPIGAGTAGAGDVISGNHANGVFILGPSAQGNIVANDLIGTRPDGTGPRPNSGDGVLIENAPGNVVGGTGTDDLNVIAANGGDGVMIENDQGDALPAVPTQVSQALTDAGYSVDVPPMSATANRVQGNWIGFNLSGVLYLMPNTDGVFLSSSGNIVGGNTVAAQNIIIANHRDGVVVSGVRLDASNNTLGAILNAQPTLNVIAANFIGTQGGGDDFGNALDGVLLYGATNNTIGGSSGAGMNVISGNNIGVVIQTGGSNAVMGNEIGTTSGGLQALPNARQGILIEASPGNTIGGAGGAGRNVVSANHWGIQIDGAASTLNAVIGNLIGTDSTGQAPLGNELDGVILSGGAFNNTIGGTGAGQGNTIAFNLSNGVEISSGYGDAILSNAIFSNDLKGIQLDGTANDSIAPPTITAALPDTALNATEVDGNYNVSAVATFLIQFFSNTTPDPSGNYEGQTPIGSTTFKSDPLDNPSGSFTVDLSIVVPTGSWITATITYLSPTPPVLGLNNGDTSEFSGATRAVSPFLVTSTADQTINPAVGTIRYAIAYSNAHPIPSGSTPNQIDFLILGGGLQTISLVSALPTITVPVVIDGYSQPGSSTNDSSQFLAPDTLDDQETDIATITVQLDGSQINAAGVAGLTIATPGCTVDGLSITGFSGAAIALEASATPITGSLGSTVWGNFVGVTQFSTRTFSPVNDAHNSNANGVGIAIDSPNNVIGGTSPVNRNIIQGNTGDGVIVSGMQGTGNTIATNFILDNGGDGVLLLSANNRIGQASGPGPAGAGNVISGNMGSGVHILDPAAKGNSVANNEIGTQVGLAGQRVPIRGTQARPNGIDGVLIEDAPANSVGGQVADSGNVLAGNKAAGVVIENYVNGTIPPIVVPAPAFISNTKGTGNSVQGNLVGFNDRNAQVQTIPNQDGVFIASSGNLVGGNATAARNTIVSNLRNGIAVSGVQLDAANNPLMAIPNAAPVSNTISGNEIGTVSGSDDYGNALDGIFLYEAGSNTVGGTSAAAGNVVANNSAGIVLEGTSSTSNLVAANLVGTTADGSVPLGNANDGIEILNAPSNIIGGTVAGAANVIAGNGIGVHLSGSSTTDNLVWGNFIGTNSVGSDLIGNSGDGVSIDANASKQHNRRYHGGRHEYRRIQRSLGSRNRPGKRQFDPVELDRLERPVGHRPDPWRQRPAGGPDAHRGGPDRRQHIDRRESHLRSGDLVPDPVLQQCHGRPLGLRARADADRLDRRDDRFQRERERQPDLVRRTDDRAGHLRHGDERVQRRFLGLRVGCGKRPGRGGIRRRDVLGQSVERPGLDLRDPNRQPRRDLLRRVRHGRGHRRSGDQLHRDPGNPRLQPQPDHRDLHGHAGHEHASVRRSDRRPVAEQPDRWRIPRISEHRGSDHRRRPADPGRVRGLSIHGRRIGRPGHHHRDPEFALGHLHRRLCDRRRYGRSGRPVRGDFRHDHLQPRSDEPHPSRCRWKAS